MGEVYSHNVYTIDTTPNWADVYLCLSQQTRLLHRDNDLTLCFSRKKINKRFPVV